MLNLDDTKNRLREHVAHVMYADKAVGFVASTVRQAYVQRQRTGACCWHEHEHAYQPFVMEARSFTDES